MNYKQELEKLKKGINKISVENEDIGSFGDGFEDAIDKVRKLIKEIISEDK